MYINELHDHKRLVKTCFHLLYRCSGIRSPLSNHYHLVLHVDREEARGASAKDVVRRWHQLFKPKEISQKFINGEHLESHELKQVDVLIDTWRRRLCDISWFMNVLNENISRRANNVRQKDIRAFSSGIAVKPSLTTPIITRQATAKCIFSAPWLSVSSLHLFLM